MIENVLALRDGQTAKRTEAVFAPTMVVRKLLYFYSRCYGPTSHYDYRSYGSDVVGRVQECGVVQVEYLR